MKRSPSAKPADSAHESNLPSQPPAPVNLEEALKELEAIVSRLEDPSTALEAAIGHYSRGVELSRICAERLAGLERQILLVQKGPQGQPQFHDLEPEEAGELDPDDR